MVQKKVNKIDLSSFDQPGAKVFDINLEEEMSRSYLEYSYSVIYSRALPDARDGLKPVQRRILYSMYKTGLRPEKNFVKSARIVGDVMGNYHPHGDSAIYDALVRLVQDWLLNAPLVEGHGNFGSLDDSPAASRYTEAKPSVLSSLLTSELGEGTVDTKLTYSNDDTEPAVLPAKFPSLLVNGAAGIAVGMATNMIPHNLGEVTKAAIFLLRNPDATLARLMRIVPGPDLPTGGRILGADQIKEAYATGRGVIRMRATAHVEPLQGSRGRNAIIVTELPYGVGPEKVIASIKENILGKVISSGKNKGQREAPKLSGIADVKDLTDLSTDGVRLQIECKSGVNPTALLGNLYRITPLETSFGINNLALVDGQPQTLGLKELLEVFLNHRRDVVQRRSTHRKDKRETRLHLVEGLLKSLVSIDDIIKIIRGSDNPVVAKERLMKRFKLSEAQAQYILDTQLRRLTKLDAFELEEERKRLEAEIRELTEILNNTDRMNDLIEAELQEIIKTYATPRKTTLVEGDLKEALEAAAPAAPLEVQDEPCLVVFSPTGGVARTATPSDHMSALKPGTAGKHPGVTSVAASTARGQYILVSNLGRGHKADTINLPVVQEGGSVNGTKPAALAPGLQPGEVIVGVAPAVASAKTDLGVALGTKNGIVKICSPDWPARSDVFDMITLKPGDKVLSAQWVTSKMSRLVFITSEGMLLHFDAGKVRPQGIKGGGVAGITLPAGAEVVSFNVGENASSFVFTATGGGSKLTPLNVYPGKGRATGGVRCQRFLKGETRLVMAWVGDKPKLTTLSGDVLPDAKVEMRRDASGSPIMAPDFVVTGWEPAAPAEPAQEAAASPASPARRTRTATTGASTAASQQSPAATGRRRPTTASADNTASSAPARRRRTPPPNQPTLTGN